MSRSFVRLPHELEKQREDFIIRLRHRKLNESSYDVACETMKYLRRVVGQGRYANLKELLALVKSEGDLLVKGDPTEFVVGNMVLRVLKLIREEHTRLMSGKDEMNPEEPQDSLNKLWEREDKGIAQITPRELKAAVIESTTEFFMELETCRDNIAAQSTDHIQDGDVVLTLGKSRSVEAFLKTAAKKSNFSVMIAENAPVGNGPELAQRLKEAKLGRVSAIPDSSIFAKMPKVTKVVLGAHSILADGGFIGPSGTMVLTLAAKRYSVPVIVLASFYKLTPKFLSAVDQESFNRLQSPRKVIPFSEGDLVNGAEVMNVAFDFIPPELVTLFITHTAGNSPSYVYRLLTENYHPDDITLMSS